MKRELKNHKVLSSKLHRKLNRTDELSVSQICHPLDISCSQGNYGYHGISVQPKQQSGEIWPIPFHNSDPINYQPEKKEFF